MKSFLARLTNSPRVNVTIRPDCDYVFISGHGEDSRGQFLRGHISLFVANNENIHGVQLKMIRRMWLGDHKEASEAAVRWRSSDIVVHQWNPFIIHNQIGTLSGNGRNYELPFELFISGHEKESFKGCSRCSLTYLLEASTIHQDSSKCVQHSLPIRVIRSPTLSAYELMDPITAQGKWSNKAEYSVSILHQAIALGGLIPIHAQITKLDHQVKITKARLFLREIHTTSDGLSTDLLTSYGQRTVSEWPLSLEDPSQNEASWEQCLHLPAAVRSCSPDFSIHGITISHTLHFAINLATNDGREMEEEISIPIHLFVSSDLPINGWGIFVRDEVTPTSKVKDMLAEGIRIPPKYCEDDLVISEYGVPQGTPPPAYSEF